MTELLVKYVDRTANPPSSPPPGSGPMCGLLTLNGPCSKPAAYRDKYGILMCAECVETARMYTCGIVPITPNAEVSGQNGPLQ